MSLESKNNIAWQPTASFDNIKRRAKLYRDIRAFFAARGVLEVETPLLCQHSVTDPYIESFQSLYSANQQAYFLQTSPEYAMKRLLAAGSGPIFQICKAFRNGESGQQHNPEFTMLEWYRPGFTHHQLMDEMDAFLQTILDCQPATRQSYQGLFNQYFACDVLQCEIDTLQQLVKQHVPLSSDHVTLERDTCLDLLLTHVIEQDLGQDAPFFLYDFPATQAALAKIRPEQPPVAERFEVYLKGREAANGFHELTDADEQEQRFLKDQQRRAANQANIPSIDQRLLAALKNGLPNCAGVAIGLDRLLMQAAKTDSISDVIAFAWERA